MDAPVKPGPDGGGSGTKSRIAIIPFRPCLARRSNLEV
ncbi:hypothetical protein ABIF61_003681 [Bradyrhizobium japonicum]